MGKTIKVGLLGALAVLTAAPVAAQAASREAQAIARARGAQLVDARWYHHRHWWRRHYYGYGYRYGYGHAYGPYWRGYPHHRYWRHRHRW